ncbi:uncharacterized protein LOC123317593 isoform X2 [Coccinella septempunctata]|uniref:uncharacterized protein LOC123317593 isoform X2 n=1 Tax=Coccinella septempunctata TaxID=41139 RepID=UPI001D068BEC|nr:uncharacterized protein LOC123317593 isoform X2 [Coccinella septempunctata]
MVYIEKDKKLGRIKRNRCCRIIPEDEHKLKRLFRQRKKHVAKELVKDVGVIKTDETEKLMNVEDRLDKKRREAEVKRASLVEQWNKLRMEEEAFHCVVVEFNQFTIENRERVRREEVRIVDLRDKRIEKELEISERRRKIVYFQNILDKMKQELERHVLYENFLNQFTNCVKAKNIDDVLYRYAVLLDSREHMEQTTNKRQISISHYSRDYSRILQNWGSKLLKFSEKLTMQSKKFEEAKRLVQYWERTVIDIEKHVQKIWTDLEMTRDALDNFVVLLLIRMVAKLSPDFLKQNRDIEQKLLTTEGRLLFMNKMLRDVARVKEEFLKEEELPGEVDESPEAERPQKIASWKKRRPLAMKFPKIGTGTALILDTLEKKMKGIAPPFDKTKTRRLSKSEESSQKSFNTASTMESDRIVGSRARAMTTWFITKEGKKRTSRHKIIEEPVNVTRTTLLSSARGREESIPWSRKSGFLPIKYSCVSLTTDPSYNILEEKRTKLRDRIVERNFERYEKFVRKNLDTDSSVMKINKKTGKLELPKLKFTAKQIQQRKSICRINIPLLEAGAIRKHKKKRDDDRSFKSTYSQASSVKTAKSKKEMIDLEEIRKFLSRPTILQHFTYGNLT